MPIVNNYYHRLSIATLLDRILLMNKRSLYEKYHKSIRIQKKIITLHNFTYKNTLIRINNYIPASGNVLDIGSATGTISFYLGSKGLDVDGIELSRHAVKYANLNKQIFKLNNVNFVNSSIENYKANKKYDLITCFEVLEHLKNDRKNLTKINGYMNKDAILAISVPSFNAPLHKLGLLKKFDKRVGHLRRYKIEEIKNLLNETGFNIIEVFKTEGVLRSLLFTNNTFGFFVKFTRFKIINDLFTFIDNLTVSIFGESQLILVCKLK
jgi:2-polyprenyl-3-methyl-5-hydroxy-6-metoxy-1,4-benzoquinol methylase